MGYAAIVAVLSIGPVFNLLSPRQAMNASFASAALRQHYGAFGSINRVRNEIVIEGTRDASPRDDAHWEEYEFPCKPGDPLPKAVPHLTVSLQTGLADVVRGDGDLRRGSLGSPSSSTNSFAGTPPSPRCWRRTLRLASLRDTCAPLFYRYEFTRWGEEGWWRRHNPIPYMRPMTVDDPDLQDFLSAIVYGDSHGGGAPSGSAAHPTAARASSGSRSDSGSEVVFSKSVKTPLLAMG
jgi:hypothetical protein